MQCAWKKDANQNEMKAKLILAARKNTRARAAKIGETECVVGAEMPAQKVGKAH